MYMWIIDLLQWHTSTTTVFGIVFHLSAICINQIYIIGSFGEGNFAGYTKMYTIANGNVEWIPITVLPI